MSISHMAVYGYGTLLSLLFFSYNHIICFLLSLLFFPIITLFRIITIFVSYFTKLSGEKWKWKKYCALKSFRFFISFLTVLTLLWKDFRDLFQLLFILYFLLIDKITSPLASWETRVQFHLVSYQRLKKWYLIRPCLALSLIRYISRVKSSNPGKEVASSPTPLCSSYWKGTLRVALEDTVPTRNREVPCDIHCPFLPASTTQRLDRV